MNDDVAQSNNEDRSPLSANAVIDRLKEVLHCENDAKLADKLPTTRSNIAKWRRRNSVPYEFVTKIAIVTGTSIDYLLTGSSTNAHFVEYEQIDYELIREIVKRLAEIGRIQSPVSGEDPASLASSVAKSIARSYNKAFEIRNTLVSQKNFSNNDAKIAATLAAVALVPEANEPAAKHADDGPQ